MVDISNPLFSTTDASNNAASPNGYNSATTPAQVIAIEQALRGAIKRVWERSGPAITTTGSANAYVYTPSNLSYPTAYVQGDVYTGLANFTNTGSATLAVNGLTPITIKKNQVGGLTLLTGGEIQSGAPFTVQYDGSSFDLLNPTPGAFTSLAIGTSSPGVYALNVVQNGANQAYFGSTGSTSSNIYIDAISGQASVINFSTGGSPKWQIFKDNGGNLHIADNVAASTILTAVTGGSLVLGQSQNFSIDSGGNATTLTQSAGNNSTRIATTAYTDSAVATVSSPVKAWCVFNGTTTGTNAPTSGLNVTSVTRNGAGDYTINFTASLTDANYAVSGSVNDPSLHNSTIIISASAAPTSSALRINACYQGVAFDASRISVIVAR